MAALREDLADVVDLIPVTVRQLAVTIAQVAAILVPSLVIAALVTQQRWRRLLQLTAAAALGFGAFVLLDRAVGIPGSVAEALDDDFWLIPARFPSPACARRGGGRRCGRQAVAGANVAPQRRPLSPARRRHDPRRRERRTRRGAAGGVRGHVRRCRRAGHSRRSEPPADTARRRRCPRAGRAVGDGPDPRAGDRRAVAALPCRCSATARPPSSRCTPGTAGTPICCTAATAACCLRDPGDDWLGGSLERAVEHEGLLLLLARNVPACGVPDLRALVGLARWVDGPRHGRSSAAANSTR